MNNIIEIKNVDYAYDKELILSDINLEIRKGEFVAISGENGAGKSTLSKMFNGLLKPLRGEVLVNGNNILKTKTSVLAKQIGFLFQNPDRQICQNTVREEIMFGQNESDIKDRLQTILDKFNLDGDKNPFALSKGERQRVALASLLAAKPSVLVLDEPTTGLDNRECILIMDYIRQCNKEGMTVIMVCHDMDIVYKYADRVIVMADGKVVADGNTRRVLQDREVINKSAILPPQMIRLAMELGSKFDNVCTVDEMIFTIKQEVLGNERVS